MSTIRNDFSKVACLLLQKVEYAWDWPNVPEKRYSHSERETLASLKRGFASVSSVAGGAACLSLGFHNPAIIISASALAIAVGQYMAGVASEKLRSRNRSGPDPE